MLTDETALPVARANLSKDMGSEIGQSVPIWNGVLREFRNHLAQLAAATDEVKALTSPVVPEIAPALVEAERNVQRMLALVAFVDAAIRGGAPSTATLDQVIERALGLAAPALGRVAVSFNRPRRIDVYNRGAALESLIAALIIELAYVGSQTIAPTTRQQIDVFADVGRDATVLEIESAGLRPSPGSWRVALAHDLATRIGASVTPPAASAGFVVRLDSRS
jgi:hypothetical protein